MTVVHTQCRTLKYCGLFLSKSVLVQFPTSPRNPWCIKLLRDNQSIFWQVIYVLPRYTGRSDYLIPLSHRPAHLCDKQQRHRLLKVPLISELHRPVRTTYCSTGKKNLFSYQYFLFCSSLRAVFHHSNPFPDPPPPVPSLSVALSHNSHG